MAKIKLARVLPGAKKFDEGNVNETFHGQILVDKNEIMGAIVKDLSLKQLCNELLASVVAKEACLPTPDAY